MTRKKLKDIPFGLKAAMTKIIKIVTCRDCQKLRYGAEYLNERAVFKQEKKSELRAEKDIG